MGALHRRLSDAAAPDAASTAMRRDIANKIRELMPHLQQMSSFGPIEAATSSLPPAPAACEVQWPAMFEPQLLACGAESQGALALSRHGRGALVSTPAMGLESFVLQGVAGHGPIVAASWDTQGLLLVTATGALLECAGAVPPAGRWACKPSSGMKLPIASSGKPFVGSVAVSRAAGELRVAVMFPGEESVTIFSRTSTEWLPFGEVRAPSSAAAVAAFSASGSELLLAAADGSVVELQMANGRRAELAAANAGHAGHGWAGACRLPSGELVRLAAATEASSVAKLILG